MKTKVKICGLTNLADARLAIECGADFLGFILAEKSPRYIEPQALAALTAALPIEIPKVGVFLNHSIAEIRRVMRDCGIDIAQLHGDEPAKTATALGIERVWKAFPLQTDADLAPATEFPAAAVLVDTMIGDQRGGTGQVGNWALAAKLAARRRVILAGGLDPANVADAIRQVQPFAVDVGSGVEAAPGRKDPDKVKAFIEAAKADSGAGRT